MEVFYVTERTQHSYKLKQTDYRNKNQNYMKQDFRGFVMNFMIKYKMYLIIKQKMRNNTGLTMGGPSRSKSQLRVVRCDLFL